MSVEMLPGAGLFLRETLYQKPPPGSSHSEVGSAKPKSSENKTGHDANGTFSSIDTIFSFVDFVVALHEVTTENRVFVDLVQAVRRDVSEAFRLHTCRAVEEHFEAFPSKKAWIDSILFDIQRALNDIGLYLENVRVGGDDGGTAKLKQKFDWVRVHHSKLISRQISLNTCHQSLMAAIQVMQAVEMGGGVGGSETAGPAPPAYQAPGKPWLEDEDDEILRSPYLRKKWRHSERNLSIPSITISEPQVNASQESVNSLPAELPGSWPGDDPDWELYAPPPKIRKSFDTIATLPQVTTKKEELHELAGSLPSLHRPSSMPQRYRARVTRKPLVKHHSLPEPLPAVPRQSSLYIDLAEFVLPLEDLHEVSISAESNENHSPTTEPEPDLPPRQEGQTNPSSSTPPGSENDASLSDPALSHSSPIEIATTSPANLDPSSEPIKPMTTQDKRRRVHNRRLEMAFGGDD